MTRINITIMNPFNSNDPHHLSQYNTNTAVEDTIVFKISSVGLLLWGFSVSSSEHREYYPRYDLN